MKEKEKQVYQILKSHGYKDKEIAGIMANIDVQTGGTFDYTTKQRGGKGYGLFQFDFLNKYYNQYLNENGIKDSAQSQIQFMDSTIRGKNKYIIGQGNAKKINETFKNGTTTQISQIFCEKWQKPGVPHLERRIESAKNYETIFSPAETKTQQKVEPPKQTATYNAPIHYSAPQFTYQPSSTSSSGFGLSSDRSNIGYSFDNGSRVSGGLFSGKPSIQISIPCQIM